MLIEWDGRGHGERAERRSETAVQSDARSGKQRRDGIPAGKRTHDAIPDGDDQPIETVHKGVVPGVDKPKPAGKLFPAVREEIVCRGQELLRVVFRVAPEPGIPGILSVMEDIIERRLGKIEPDARQFLAFFVGEILVENVPVLMGDDGAEDRGIVIHVEVRRGKIEGIPLPRRDADALESVVDGEGIDPESGLESPVEGIEDRRDLLNTPAIDGLEGRRIVPSVAFDDAVGGDGEQDLNGPELFDLLDRDMAGVLGCVAV